MSSSFYALNLKINSYLSAVKQLTTDVFNLNNTQIFPVSPVSRVLVFDASNLPFRVWTVDALSEPIETITFENLRINGLYTIYITIGGSSVTVLKTSSSNNLSGDITCAPFALFVLTVFYNGNNPLVQWNSFT